MTDPGWADATYIEPLDLEGVADRAARASGPTRCCPRWAARRRSTWPWSCRGAGVLDELGIELIGASAKAIDTAEDREAVRRRHGLGRPARAALGDRPHVAEAEARRRVAASCRCRSRSARRSRSAATAAASPTRSSELRRTSRAASPRVPIGQVLVEESLLRLGRVRARGDPRPPRQRRDRLLDREPRPDGRPHRRLGLRRAGHDAVRPRVPGAARRGRRPSSAPSASRRAARTCSSRSTARPARSS